MKALRLKLYDNKLFGHSEAICGIYSPQGDKGGILVTVSKDGCLRGWDIFERKKISKIFLLRNPPATVTEEDSETKEKEAFDPLSIVECCIFNKKSVFCGYSDGSIYAYNMKTGNIVYIFQGHEDKVSGIEWIDANTFVTCAYDETIVFWDSMNGVATAIIKMNHEVTKMKKFEDKLFAIVNYNELNILGIEDKKIERTVLFQDMNITTLHITEQYLMIADHFNFVYVIKKADLENENMEKNKLIGHTSWILQIETDSRFIYTCSDDKSVKVWDINTFELLDELTGHQNGVSCLAFANMHIWTGSYDSSVKSWDYVDLLHRIRERRNMKKMELYSFQAEAYQNYVDAKKSKRKRRKKKKGGMKKR